MYRRKAERRVISYGRVKGCPGSGHLYFSRKRYRDTGRRNHRPLDVAADRVGISVQRRRPDDDRHRSPRQRYGDRNPPFSLSLIVRDRIRRSGKEVADARLHQPVRLGHTLAAQIHVRTDALSNTPCLYTETRTGTLSPRRDLLTLSDSFYRDLCLDQSQRVAICSRDDTSGVDPIKDGSFSLGVCSRVHSGSLTAQIIQERPFRCAVPNPWDLCWLRLSAAISTYDLPTISSYSPTFMEIVARSGANLAQR